LARAVAPPPDVSAKCAFGKDFALGNLFC